MGLNHGYPESIKIQFVKKNNTYNAISVILKIPIA